jgi:hypothetical protein
LDVISLCFQHSRPDRADHHTDVNFVSCFEVTRTFSRFEADWKF